MTDPYMQYFTSHAHDLQWRLRKTEEEILAELTETIPMSEEQKLDLADRLTVLRTRCSKESFAMGVELGLRIGWEFSIK